MNKRLLLSALVFISLSGAVPSYAAKCTGSANCAACKNCNGCQYCSKQGGKCGICAQKRNALPKENNLFSGKVVGISDGDTIKVMRDGKALTIRLWGIDCPEKAQPFGTKAKEFTGDKFFGKTVDVEIKDIDRYGRSVGIVRLEGKSLNDELVKNGMAWWYRKYAPQDTQLAGYELKARKERVGLWVDNDPVAPWNWRSDRKKKR